MAFENERSTGLSLRVFKDLIDQFEGEVRQMDSSDIQLPRLVIGNGKGRVPRFIVGIDGSSVTHTVRNGFPCADSSLISLSVVLVDMSALNAVAPDAVPPPSLFYSMEKPVTLATILPGANVTRKNMPGDTPLAYYRDSIRHNLDVPLQQGHETLTETLSALWKGDRSRNEMLCVSCEEKVTIPDPVMDCPHCGAALHVTDSLSLWKSFNEEGPCGQSHGEFRSAMEVLALVNILRFLSTPEHIGQINDFGFFLDGPLGMFGNLAKLSPHIKREMIRLNDICRTYHSSDLMIFGLEKTGPFKEHMEILDHCDEKGPRKKLNPKTAVLLDSNYINRRIVMRDSRKDYGDTTYFGRKVLYKTGTGLHAVINTAILNREGERLSSLADDAFPCLQDILVVFDRLGSHLYRDGFMPAIRAHAHASIPLRQGGNILKDLFRDRPRAPAAVSK